MLLVSVLVILITKLIFKREMINVPLSTSIQIVRIAKHTPQYKRLKFCHQISIGIQNKSSSQNTIHTKNIQSAAQRWRIDNIIRLQRVYKHLHVPWMEYSIFDLIYDTFKTKRQHTKRMFFYCSLCRRGSYSQSRVFHILPYDNVNTNLRYISNKSER